MKTLKSVTFQSIAAASVVVGMSLPFTMAYAQAPDVASAARDACTQSAQTKGFQVAEVVSIEPKGTDGANVVLSLTRDGQPYKLTCGYTKSGGAMFGDDTAGTATATAPDYSRLWWLLLPLIGMPLLLWWASGRDKVARAGVNHHEGIVRGLGNPVDVHAGPAASYKVTDTLRDGERVVLTGRHENNWAELRNGSWIPVEYLEESSYVTR
jgi:hypothetical protein